MKHFQLLIRRGFSFCNAPPYPLRWCPSTFNKYSAILLCFWHFLCRTENRVVNEKYKIPRCQHGAYVIVDSGSPHSPSFTLPLPIQFCFAVLYKCLLINSGLSAFIHSLLASSISSPPESQGSFILLFAIFLESGSWCMFHKCFLNDQPAAIPLIHGRLAHKIPLYSKSHPKSG